MTRRWDESECSFPLTWRDKDQAWVLPHQKRGRISLVRGDSVNKIGERKITSGTIPTITQQWL